MTALQLKPNVSEEIKLTKFWLADRKWLKNWGENKASRKQFLVAGSWVNWVEVSRVIL